MSSMTDKMSKSPRGAVKQAGAQMPTEGDHFRCQKCGMEMEITAACNCKDPDHVHFQCCGRDMEKV